MKSLLVALSLLAVLTIPVNAQIDLEGMVKKKVEKKAKGEAGKAIDKGIDEAEKAVKGGGEKEKEADEKKGDPTKETPSGTNEPASIDDAKAWSRYDFVSGEKIIFEDDLGKEINGEFPSRWDLSGGNAENARFGTANVISFQARSTEITPLMKTKNYLPEIFTIEFDIYFHHKGNEAYMLRFDTRNTITIRNSVVTMGKFNGKSETTSNEPGWRKVALSFNKRSLKVYFNQDRVLNIPNVKFKPERFSIEALSHSAPKGYPAMLKDIRLAEGGVKLYDRIVAEGKFVTRGIYFASGKAIVRPESYGTLNEIAALMKEHSALHFRIEGHTDSDGDDALNQTLSIQRAKAVRDALTRLDIDPSRLDSDGWGESKPVDTNDTPEGKANNRRVEFIKL